MLFVQVEPLSNLYNFVKGSNAQSMMFNGLLKNSVMEESENHSQILTQKEKSIHKFLTIIFKINSGDYITFKFVFFNLWLNTVLNGTSCSRN